MPKECIRVENDIELWRVTHPVETSVEAYFVKDPRRTPEDWGFDNLAEASAKFEERVENAKTQPPLR